jgi:hypothetical protein
LLTSLANRLPLNGLSPTSAGGFDQQQWYSQLFEYGVVGHEAATDDPDGNLVPKLVESLILPQAMHLVSK